MRHRHLRPARKAWLLRALPRAGLSSYPSSPNIQALPEVIQAEKFTRFLASPTAAAALPRPSSARSNLTGSQLECLVEAGFATFALHVQARVASALGTGFYTIGPCGEELTGVLGLLLRPGDTSALHYRHLAAQIARHRQLGKSMPEIILDRARGYVCSTLDPVTGGRHCALGGAKDEYYVTSTLASQTPPAVGRALADPLLRALQLPAADGVRPADSVHLVSLGDGSVNNAHFLAARNLAENAAFRGIKCPVVFCISDNDLSISLKGHGWLPAFCDTFRAVRVFKADGRAAHSAFAACEAAFRVAREEQSPAAVVLSDMPRRFGHAASDRQWAYLSAAEIASAQDANVLEGLCADAARVGGWTVAHMRDLWFQTQSWCRDAFERAAREPKLGSAGEVMAANQAPFPSPAPRVLIAAAVRRQGARPSAASRSATDTEKLTMRKCMTRAWTDAMRAQPDVVMLGEDIRHGGYYLVTEALAKHFPLRVLDFPPDETTLLGVGLGMAQRGLCPVVEVPYLAYLNCGLDMFQEICLLHWATNGRERSGLVVRLQGFDRGTFGGNFHTHNSLHLFPGLDMVCFSNGPDYVRGVANAMRAARAGRVVAVLEPTEALNRRHVVDGDDAWLFEYPAEAAPSSAAVTPPHSDLGFDDVVLYRNGEDDAGRHHPAVFVVAYGNGVVQALQAQREFPPGQVTVVDCPLLSRPPAALVELLREAKSRRGNDHRAAAAVLFADSCKLGQNPFGHFVQVLRQAGALPERWGVVAAAATYNPLGSTVTFLDREGIAAGIRDLLA